MNIKKIILISIFLLALVTISTVSAEDNATLSDSILQTTNEDISDVITFDDSQTADEYSQSDLIQSSSVDENIKASSSEDENSDSPKAVGSENFTIKLYEDYFIYGETNTFGFLMPKDIGNNVSVVIDEKSYDYDVITNINDPYPWLWGGDYKTQNGYMVTFSDLKPGIHELIISYPGDDFYGECRLVKNITVEGEEDITVKENFTITFYEDYFIYGETNIFGFLMPKDIENNVSVVIDAKGYLYDVYDINDSDLWVWGGDSQTQRGYMVKFSYLYPGNHEVVISYPGDSKYSENRLEKIITVNGDANFHTFSQIQNVIDSVEENSTVILNGTYMGSGEEIIIRKNITLLGVGKNTVLDANYTSRILNITSGSVTLRNLKFINAKNIVNCGGAVYAAGELIVDNCTFKENVVCLDGGSGLTVEEIYDKQVSGEMDIKAHGGAIYCESNLTVMNSIFYGNDAKSYEVWREMDYYGWQDSAGATTIYVKENLILNNTTITKYGYGGTCDVEAGGNLEIYGCQFNGARTNYGRSATVNNSEFNGRSSLQSYAFEYFEENTSCTILNSIFKNSDKILLRVGNELIVIENNNFTGCNVENNDFILLSGDVIEISNNDFSNNSVLYRGMLWIWGGNQVKMSNNTFTDNHVIGNHIFYIDNSIVSFKNSNASITGCDFINNSASVAGAIYCYNSNLSIDECSFKNNSHVAISLENAYLKINGKDFGHYSKELLNDSFVLVPDSIEIVVPETFTFKYPAKDIKIEIPAKLIYNEDLKLSFSIIVSSDGKDLTYLSKDSENGVLSFSLKDDLSVGTYSLRIIQNDYDIDITSKIIIAVEPVITAADAKVTYSDGSYYTIKITGFDEKLADGEKVVIKVNNKIFKTLKTTNGIAKFKITNVPGTYKMTIISLGKSVKRTLTVKHLVGLKSVAVKKSAKKLVLTATLGKINKKFLKNKKITFKFNGKKYTAKTNKKGVAKVTIKSSVLKKIKVGKKVTYQATYSKDTVKKTVKIKK